ncbi:MAG: hypothetical protein HYY13_01200 [Nitrospirae bacterium]|nr:hypothetical protein [Nitrospirota bacterium]
MRRRAGQSSRKVDISIPEAVRQMLAIVGRLRQAHPKKRFTLDGRLVGDIGEILAEAAYQLKLFEDLQKHHDARTADGRLVQIKATMQRSLTFPVDHIPECYLGILVHPDGTFSEIFNGPGIVAHRAVQKRRPTKTNLHSVRISTLLKLNRQEVDPGARIALRPGSAVRPVPAREVR